MNEYEDIPTLIDTVIKSLSAQLDKAKHDIINERIKALGLKPLEIEEQRRKRFKDLTCEHSPGWENYYFNDGSDRGRFIVSFSVNEFDLPAVGNEKDFSIKAALKYRFE